MKQPEKAKRAEPAADSHMAALAAALVKRRAAVDGKQAETGDGTQQSEIIGLNQAIAKADVAKQGTQLEEQDFSDEDEEVKQP